MAQYRDLEHKIEYTHYKQLHIVTMKKQQRLPLIEVEEISWKQASRYMAKLTESSLKQKKQKRALLKVSSHDA